MAQGKKTPQEVIDFVVSYHGTDLFHKDIALEVERVLGYRITRQTVGKILQDYLPDPDQELVVENVKLAKQKQAAQDKNRIANKAFREQARHDNALAELLAEYNSNIKLLPPIETIQHALPDHKYAGIIQLSDVHFNERVEDVGGNNYDFTIAGQRLRKHVLHSMRIFDAYGVKSVVLALTADMFNSDRRLDEILNNATNRAKGFFCGCDIMTQLITELNTKYNVTVASVVGNEGRIDQIREYGEASASNNFDFMLHEFLKRRFASGTGITFEYQKPNYCILNVNGKNILLLHGDNSDAKNPRKMMEKAQAKFIASLGVPIDYVLSGHIHEAYISDYFGRSGSTVGNNAYNYDGLNITGRASQNSYVVSPSGSIHGFKTDLQDYEHIEGYTIEPQLEEYNAKSAAKNAQPLVIHQVVI